MRESMGRERQTSPVVAAIGHFLMGLIVGVVSIAVLPTRLIGRGGFRGISLFLSPLGTGLAMHALGDFWRERGSEPSALFTFRGGAAFAFGMALVRFVYVERMFF